MSAPPSISVIVACKNPGSRLPVALESVWAQRNLACELIVVDGASTDGSRAWLEARRSRLAALISEPDDGVYAALNKGIAAARGEWIYFLGSDDRLVGENVLSETLNWMRKTEAGVVGGEVAYQDGRIHKLSSNVNAIAGNFLHHQAAFYRRTLFEENDHFDSSLSIMGDYDFNVRLWKSRVRFKPIPVRIAACGVGGVRRTSTRQGYREEITVRRRYFSRARCLPWDVVSFLRSLTAPSRAPRRAAP